MSSRKEKVIKIASETDLDSVIRNNEITGEDLLNSNIEEIPCLLEPLMQRAGLAALAGSSDTGKSTLLRQLAIAIVTGQKDFLGFRLNQIHKSVIFVATEDFQRETAFFLKKQARYFNPEDLKGLRFLFDDENEEDLLQQLDTRLSNSPADAVIIDCFSDAFGNDLKDTPKLRNYLNPFQKLAKKHDCLFLFLHHTGKRTENFEPSKNNLLSGQGFEAKMRLVIELRVDLTVPNHRHLCIVKGNYLPGKMKKESYILLFDETDFQFTNTNEKVTFDKLAKSDNKDSQQYNEYQITVKLIDEGKTHREIADHFGYESSGQISKIIERGKKKGWDTSPPF